MKNYKQLYLQSQLENSRLRNNLNPVKIPICNQQMYAKLLQIRDLSMCVNRFKWDVDTNLTSENIETYLYQLQSLLLWEDKNGNIRITNYARQGQLNSNGIMEELTPIDFGGKSYEPVKNVLADNFKKGDRFGVVIYDFSTMVGGEETSREVMNISTTIKDQTIAYSQLVNDMLILGAKAIALCDNEEQANVIRDEVSNLIDPSNLVIPITKSKKGKGIMDNLELLNLNVKSNAQDLVAVINFYDKQRRVFNGISSPDTFEKKERLVSDEVDETNTHTNLILINGYYCRKFACEMFNKYSNFGNKVNVDISPYLKEQFKIVKEDGSGEVFNNN